MFKSKQLRLATIIFIPLFVLVSLFAGSIYYLYQGEIDSIGEYFSEQAYEIGDFPEERDNLDEILTDNDWETLSDFQIDKKLQLAGHQIIGDPTDPFYKLTPQEIDQQYDNFLGKEKAGSNSEVLFLDPDMLEDPASYSESSSLPYISVDQIQELESGISEKSLLSIVLLLGISALGLGGIAWFLSLKSLKPLEMALQKQKEFVGNVSHELRTPLAMIKTEAEVLLRSKEKKSDEVARFVKNTVQDISHLDDLITQLLQLSQIDASTYSEISTIHINSDWDYLMNRFQTQATQSKKEFLMPNIKKISIKKPPIDFRTILGIVLDNAFKYTPKEGRILVKMIESKNSISVEVKDSGAGIDPKDLPYIFERFYRADKARTTNGFGLGLSLVKESLAFIGGTIKVIETSENGTTFSLFFPKE